MDASPTALSVVAVPALVVAAVVVAVIGLVVHYVLQQRRATERRREFVRTLKHSAVTTPVAAQKAKPAVKRPLPAVASPQSPTATQPTTPSTPAGSNSSSNSTVGSASTVKVPKGSKTGATTPTTKPGTSSNETGSGAEWIVADRKGARTRTLSKEGEPQPAPTKEAVLLPAAAAKVTGAPVVEKIATPNTPALKKSTAVTTTPSAKAAAVQQQSAMKPVAKPVPTPGKTTSKPAPAANGAHEEQTSKFPQGFLDMLDTFDKNQLQTALEETAHRIESPLSWELVTKTKDENSPAILREKLLATEKDHADLRKQNELLCSQIEGYKTQKDRLERDLRARDTTLSDLTNKHQSETMALQGNVDMLTKQLHDEKSKAIQATIAAAAAAPPPAAVAVHAVVDDNEIQDLKAQFAQSEQQAVKLQHLLNEEKQNASRNTQTIQAAHDAAISKIESELALSKSALQDSQTDVKKLKEQVKQLDKDLADHRSREEAASKKGNTLVQELTAAKQSIQTIKASLTEAKAAHTGLQNSEQLSEEKTTPEAKSREPRPVLATVAPIKASDTPEYKLLEKSLATSETEKAAIQQSLAKVKDENETLQRKLTAASEDAAMQSKQAFAYSQQLIQQLGQLHEEHAVLQKTIDEYVLAKASSSVSETLPLSAVTPQVTPNYDSAMYAYTQTLVMKLGDVVEERNELVKVIQSQRVSQPPPQPQQRQQERPAQQQHAHAPTPTQPIELHPPHSPDKPHPIVAPHLTASGSPFSREHLDHNLYVYNQQLIMQLNDSYEAHQHLQSAMEAYLNDIDSNEPVPSQQPVVATANVDDGRHSTGAAEEATAPAASAAAEDNFDLFADDDEEVDEEREKLKAKRLSEYNAKKASKPAVIAKSSILLDVKPVDDETKMAELENGVRNITADGLLWGSSKLVPVAYGVKKLQIMCTVEDDKVSVDWLEEQIMELSDHVQSVDVVSFQKL